MAKRLEFTCDGCDKVEMTPIGEGQPHGWGLVSVEITGLSNPYIAMNDAAGPRTYDLCGYCQNNLYATHNPRHWPRKEDTDATR